MNVKTSDVAVIIGRFQVPDLHEAHRELIDSVVKNHSRTIIFLGLSTCLSTRNNPLDFEARKQMLLQAYPDVTVLYIKDVKSDEFWSGMLDRQISDIVSPNQSVTLYGGRDAFIKHYKGKFPTVELESKIYVSGTEIRNSISKKVKGSPDFRAGVIWATFNQFPKVYATVDVAIMNEDNTRILLGRKLEEEQYRFIGGFSMPDSDSFEIDAKREVSEEAGIEISWPEYIGSFKINDWRYSREIDKIKTNFYYSKYLFGSPRAGDDIAEIRWFDIDKIKESDIVEGHWQLFLALLAKLNRNKGEIK